MRTPTLVRSSVIVHSSTFLVGFAPSFHSSMRYLIALDALILSLRRALILLAQLLLEPRPVPRGEAITEEQFAAAQELLRRMASASAMRGTTSTAAKLVWRLPAELNGLMRTRRCVPASTLSVPKA